jgi:bifunctional DNA-binding transcriptional regulator/antitoxin component of YhaV-PrlF toxin-antitoxin module
MKIRKLATHADGITIPKVLLLVMGWKVGDELTYEVADGALKLSKPRNPTETK